MNEPQKPILIMRVTDSGEVMVTSPTGEMQFMGWLKAIKLAWTAMRLRWEVRVEE